MSFTESSPSTTDWAWDFGDGGSSAIQNPSHPYGPGLYDVRLTVAAAWGGGSKLKANYITALAETLEVDDRAVAPSTSFYWEIWHHNNVPLTEIRLPIALTNIPVLATMDSLSTVGCRTAYFERKLVVFDNRGAGQMAIRLKADNGGGSPPLAPGNGAILRIYMRTKSNAQAGEQIALSMPQLGSQTLSASTLTTSGYVPVPDTGTVTITGPCVCFCHGDPACDGQQDILDVVETVNVAFRGTPATLDGTCPHAGRSDVNCSGATDVIDVVIMTNLAFRGADPVTTICNPCN